RVFADDAVDLAIEVDPRRSQRRSQDAPPAVQHLVRRWAVDRMGQGAPYAHVQERGWVDVLRSKLHDGDAERYGGIQDGATLRGRPFPLQGRRAVVGEDQLADVVHLTGEEVGQRGVGIGKEDDLQAVDLRAAEHVAVEGPPLD